MTSYEQCNHGGVKAWCPVCKSLNIKPKRNMQKFKPFSNATEATHWMDNNCYQCKTSRGCSGKLNIEMGFITGEITIGSAWKIGMVDKQLSPTCRMKDKRQIKKLKQQYSQSVPSLF